MAMYELPAQLNTRRTRKGLQMCYVCSQELHDVPSRTGVVARAMSNIASQLWNLFRPGEGTGSKRQASTIGAWLT